MTVMRTARVITAIWSPRTAPALTSMGIDADRQSTLVSAEGGARRFLVGSGSAHAMGTLFPSTGTRPGGSVENSLTPSLACRPPPRCRVVVDQVRDPPPKLGEEERGRILLG